MNIIISGCPTDLLDRVELASKSTYEDHRAQQPYSFPENGWEHVFQTLFSNSFIDANGHPVGESQNLLIAEIDGLFAGYILLSWWARDDAPVYHSGSIDDIHVCKEYRGKGVGEALLIKAKEISEARQWDNLEARIRAGNSHSKDLFSKAGFTVQSEILRFGPTGQVRPIVPDESNESDRAGEKDGPSLWLTWLLILGIAGLTAYLTR